VTVPPGAGSDFTARLIGQWLSERLGQQFIIENRPGGGGNIGTEAFVRAPPDGYTLLMIGSGNVVNTTLFKLNFNFIRDIAPVASLARVPLEATCLAAFDEIHPVFHCDSEHRCPSGFAP
jgi:tripartite-type tricarboxylate transporter receptor subunit TctC